MNATLPSVIEDDEVKAAVQGVISNEGRAMTLEDLSEVLMAGSDEVAERDEALTFALAAMARRAAELFSS